MDEKRLKHLGGVLLTSFLTYIRYVAGVVLQERDSDIQKRLEAQYADNLDRSARIGKLCVDLDALSDRLTAQAVDLNDDREKEADHLLERVKRLEATLAGVRSKMAEMEDSDPNTMNPCLLEDLKKLYDAINSRIDDIPMPVSLGIKLHKAIADILAEHGYRP